MIRRIIGRVHLWLGLALGAPLALIGLTGSVLVLEDELRGAAADRPARLSEARSAAEIVAAARAVAPPGFVPATYAAPAAPGGAASVRLVPPRRDGPGFDGVRASVDPVTLEAVIDEPGDLLRWIFQLHSTLQLQNRVGRQAVGWLGVAMLAMGVSGLVNCLVNSQPRRGGWRAAFAVTRGARGLRLLRELHGAVGVWGFLVLIVVSFAGVYLAFPETVRAIVDPLLPARDLRAEAAKARVAPIPGIRPADIDEAMALAEAAIAGARTNVVFLPTHPDRPYRIALSRPDQDRKAPAVTVLVDPWSRRVAATYDPRQLSAGERLLAWQHALHAGRGLGWVWKILVFISGLLPLLFALTGAAIWWLKRRRRLAESLCLALDEGATVRRAAE